MRTVIFLDVDGVLNCSDTIEKCCGYNGIESKKVELLKQLVDATDADIVLISTWKKEYKTDEWGGSTQMGRYLVKKLREYGLIIYDKAPDISWRARAKEIKVWINNNQPVDRMIILDDEDFYYDDLLFDYWVCTQSPNTYVTGPGLMQHNVDDILNRLDDFNVRGEIT